MIIFMIYGIIGIIFMIITTIWKLNDYGKVTLEDFMIILFAAIIWPLMMLAKFKEWLDYKDFGEITLFRKKRRKK